jgi:selenophosphate synthetase-related protein
LLGGGRGADLVLWEGIAAFFAPVETSVATVGVDEGDAGLGIEEDRDDLLIAADGDYARLQSVTRAFRNGSLTVDKMVIARGES